MTHDVIESDQTGKVGHTPGPWTCNDVGLILSADDDIIGQAGTAPGGPDESVSNGFLIAAAPDLLAACKAIQHDSVIGPITWTAHMVPLIAAIAKAESGVTE